MVRLKFLGGYNIKSALKFAENVSKKNKIPVLNYAIENSKFKDQNLKVHLNLVNNLNPGNNIAIKLSSFDYDKILINNLIENCINKDIKIFIDAENEKFYKIYNSLSSEMIIKYNQKKTNLYKTYQMYRKDSLINLKKDFEIFNNLKVNFGVKLVRGAYWNSEKKLGYLFTKKKETDVSYNNAIYYLHNKKNTDVILATHNIESINLGLLLNENTNSKFKFAHLLDMNEKIYYELSKNNFVYVYIPFGPLSKMLPYLLRRLYENIDTIKYMI